MKSLGNHRDFCWKFKEELRNMNFDPGELRQGEQDTWWLIPLSKWVITPVINGISRVNPLIIGVITHLLSG
jgi:hypothetical protein